MGFSITEEKEVKKFFIIFNAVGVLGFLIEQTTALFIKLIPFSLMLNFIYLAYFHCNKRDVKQIFVFSFILLAGLFVEIVGVNTGKIFGEYHYGKSLGVKIFGTPVLIALNWLFLTYTTASILEKRKYSTIAKILIASALMLIYDIVLEQVAPKLNMWDWKNGGVPMQNYLCWFCLSVVFHSAIKIFHVKTLNPISSVVLYSQFSFFVLLFIFLK